MCVCIYNKIYIYIYIYIKICSSRPIMHSRLPLTVAPAGAKARRRALLEEMKDVALQQRPLSCQVGFPPPLADGAGATATTDPTEAGLLHP